MRRAGCLTAFAGALVVAAALHAYLERDYRPVFSRVAGELVMVRDMEDIGLTGDGAVVQEVTLVADHGFEVRARVRVPPDIPPGERRPAALLIGGLGTGIRAAEVPDGTAGMILASIEYPYGGPRGRLGTWKWIRHSGEIRRAFFDTPAALLLAAQYLYSRPDVDADRVSIVGVSLGVPFATAAAASDTRLGGAALLHGGGDVRRLILGLNPEGGWTAQAGALAAAWLLGPLDPVRYVDDISPRPILMINASGDEMIPRESVLALYEAARRPKRIVWIEGAHVTASDAVIVDELMGLTLEWLERNDLR